MCILHFWRMKKKKRDIHNHKKKRKSVIQTNFLKVTVTHNMWINILSFHHFRSSMQTMQYAKQNQMFLIFPNFLKWPTKIVFPYNLGWRKPRGSMWGDKICTDDKRHTFPQKFCMFSGFTELMKIVNSFKPRTYILPLYWFDFVSCLSNEEIIVEIIQK